MMRDTPRTFVGPVVLVLEESVSSVVATSACAEVEQLPGVGSCTFDAAPGTVVVTAHSPVDRTVIVSTLVRLGCRLRA
jgi:hypothetical protein